MENKKENKDKKKYINKWWFILVAVFLILILLSAGFLLWYEITYAEKFYPKTKIGYLDVSGKNKEEAFLLLREVESNLLQKNLPFKANGQEIKISPIIISEQDPDLAKVILAFDWQKTIDAAFNVGRYKGFLNNLKERAESLIYGRNISAHYSLDQEGLIDALKYELSEFEIEPVNAGLKIENNKAEITVEKNGQIFNYKKAANELIKNIENLNFEKIEIEFTLKEAEIKKEHTNSVLNNLEKILEADSFRLSIIPNWWRVENTEFVQWLEFQKIDGEIVIGFNKDKVLEFLKPISETVNVLAQDAKFEISGERVIKFQPSRDGKELDLEKSFEKINHQVIMGELQDIELDIKVAKANVETGDINDLGIKDLIGRGISNFTGSPTNRRHNIAVGAASLNGLLIKPDQEFSLNSALGKIDGEHGYKQELVIKGNRTIPEYGGGLCQIATTAFRVALRSGLPITMRRPHSYRVVYYEPAGMDATIYNPSPDLKFINDTGHHILLITYINGDELIFDFYGTKDGRKIEISPDPPSISNIRSPGPARYIETDELAPGQKRKIESAHSGADTYFKYTVIYSNGEEKITDFNSRYVAWPEVWLIGKEPEPEEIEKEAEDQKNEEEIPAD